MAGTKVLSTPRLFSNKQLMANVRAQLMLTLTLTLTLSVGLTVDCSSGERCDAQRCLPIEELSSRFTGQLTSRDTRETASRGKPTTCGEPESAKP